MNGLSEINDALNELFAAQDVLPPIEDFNDGEAWPRFWRAIQALRILVAISEKDPLIGNEPKPTKTQLRILKLMRQMEENRMLAKPLPKKDSSEKSKKHGLGKLMN